MGVVNLDEFESAAIKAVDKHKLAEVVDQAIRDEQVGDLRRLQLASCGPYVADRLRQFEQALLDHGRSRSAKKRAETRYRVERAGSDLSFAVSQMKHRIEEEEKDGELFYVDDRIMPPLRYSATMSVNVHYRWRPSVESDWTDGKITFLQEVDVRPDHRLPLPKRNPSAAKLAEDLQNKLSQEWDSLMKQALWAVRDFFKQGGDGAKIPSTFTAIRDHSGNLNNFSAKFWSAGR